MPHAQSNPPWDKAEIILALDLYLNHESNTKHGSSSEIEKLSETLRRLSSHEDVADPDRFRNVNSVTTKLSNLQFLDPNDPAKGLSGASTLDRQVWDDYHDKPELVHQIAESIVAAMDGGDVGAPQTMLEDDVLEEEYYEGRFFYRMHRTRERNRRAVDAAKKAAIERGDGLRCCVCGFDFERVYGQLGKGFIECHHTKPISEYRKGDVTRVEDLVLVCSNCHRMLHRSHPILRPEELRSVLKE